MPEPFFDVPEVRAAAAAEASASGCFDNPVLRVGDFYVGLFRVNNAFGNRPVPSGDPWLRRTLSCDTSRTRRRRWGALPTARRRSAGKRQNRVTALGARCAA
jgi:hypothetical protein